MKTAAVSVGKQLLFYSLQQQALLRLAAGLRCGSSGLRFAMPGLPALQSGPAWQTAHYRASPAERRCHSSIRERSAALTQGGTRCETSPPAAAVLRMMLELI